MTFHERVVAPRLQEQFGYGYDKAWNLNARTNDALIQNFAVNDLNELSSAGQSGTLTVAGSTTEPGYDVTNVSANGEVADECGDGTFAAPAFMRLCGTDPFLEGVNIGYTVYNQRFKG